MKPLWELIFFVQWKLWKSFSLIHGPFILRKQWKSKMISLPMEFRMRIFIPNETLKGFHPPIKYDDNLYDQWNWRTHPFLYFGHFDEFFELDCYSFGLFDFHILLLYLNYFK
jgi:hypothetical protein